MKSLETIKKEIIAARNQVEGLKQVLKDRKNYLESIIKPYAKLDKATGFITSKGQVGTEVQNAAETYRVILRMEKAIDADPAVILLDRQEAELGYTENNKIMKDTSKNAKFVEKKYKQVVERFKKSSLDLAFFEKAEKYIKNECDFGDGKKVHNVTKHNNSAVAKIAANKGKIAIGVLSVGALAALIYAGVKYGPMVMSNMKSVPNKSIDSTQSDLQNEEKNQVIADDQTYDLVASTFVNVNDETQVRRVVDEAMKSLGDFASEAMITEEDMRNIIYALNAPYVANYDALDINLRTDVNDKLLALYRVYLGSNDTRLFGISDGKKNGPHNFELSKLFVADTPNLGLIQEFDEGLNKILDADEVTDDVTLTASKLYARLAYQVKVVKSESPIIDETEEECYGLCYAYALVNDVIFPIFEPCNAGFTTPEGYEYSSKSGEDIVKEANADQLNRTGINLQSYIKGNCPKLG